MKASDFFIRSAVNTGQQLAIPDPITNEDSGEFLTVLSFESDIFAEAQLEEDRSKEELEALPEEERKAAKRALDTRKLASVVIGWTLETEFTPENVIEFLTEAPFIRSKIINFCVARQNFVKKL